MRSAGCTPHLCLYELGRHKGKAWIIRNILKQSRAQVGNRSCGLRLIKASFLRKILTISFGLCKNHSMKSRVANIFLSEPRSRRDLQGQKRLATIILRRESKSASSENVAGFCRQSAREFRSSLIFRTALRRSRAKDLSIGRRSIILNRRRKRSII